MRLSTQNLGQGAEGRHKYGVERRQQRLGSAVVANAFSAREAIDHVRRVRLDRVLHPHGSRPVGLKKAGYVSGVRRKPVEMVVMTIAVHHSAVP
jgi:hypothetical protein